MFWTGFEISGDGSRVVYRADQESDEAFELFSVPLAGGDSVKLNRSLPAGATVLAGFQLSEDGRDVVYIADQEITEMFELYKAPIAGGDSIKISDPLITEGGVLGGFRLTSAANVVVFRASADRLGPVGLYASTLDDAGGLSASLIVTGTSHVTVEFNADLDVSGLNLYDTLTGQLGPADAALIGAETGRSLRFAYCRPVAPRGNVRQVGPSSCTRYVHGEVT